jgi:hypothetical protein
MNRWKHFSVNDSGSTLNDGDEAGPGEENHKSKPTRDVIVAAAAISSTINPKTLETCVQYIQSLIKYIEVLQHTVTNKFDGTDHSEHHQIMINTYFRAREHLDSVLFGGSPKPGAEATSALNKGIYTKAHLRESQNGIYNTISGSTLHSTASDQQILVKTDVPELMQEVFEKARKDMRDRNLLEARASHSERRLLQLEVEKKILEYERMMRDQSMEKSTKRQLSIESRDTLESAYSFPFQTLQYLGVSPMWRSLA